MNKRKLGQYKKLLERSLERLVEEASETLNGMSAEKALFPDPTDRPARTILTGEGG
ncbi:MAG: DNA (cytosine-5-)-methyltransferase, partial [Thermodesulfobacteriota bacterium]